MRERVCSVAASTYTLTERATKETRRKLLWDKVSGVGRKVLYLPRRVHIAEGDGALTVFWLGLLQ